MFSKTPCFILYIIKINGLERSLFLNGIEIEVTKIEIPIIILDELNEHNWNKNFKIT